MSELDLDTLRYAIQTARDNGLKVVNIKLNDQSFKATIGERELVEEEELIEEAPAGPITMDVTAPAVGYYRTTKNYKIGSKVESGEVVGEIVALGIANDIVAKGSGQVVQVLTKEGDPLEYGQAVLVLEKS